MRAALIDEYLLTIHQAAELEAVLDAGRAAWGWMRTSAGRWPGSPRSSGCGSGSLTR
jgi:hypothetical protein